MKEKNQLSSKQLSQIFKTFYKSETIQDSFRLLKQMLAEIMPMDRITAFCVYENVQTIVILVDTEVETAKSVLHDFSFTRSVFSDVVLYKPAIHNDLVPYRNIEGDKYIEKSPLYGNNSMIRIPFLKRNMATLILDFFSVDKNAYLDEHFSFLQELINSINDELSELFSFITSEVSSIEKHKNYSPFEYLRMCPSLHEICRTIAKVSETNATVLIQGETGSGKELVALALHEQSQRNQNELVVLNCGALPENLIDSELFGYEKGAFTGALQSFKGAFERAQNSTLFLDEIGEMPLHIQTRLLRAIENMTIRRIGGSKNIYLDVRIIAATNIDLEQAVKEGKFRQDLLYRLNLIKLDVPPLRRRQQDIKGLTNFFINKFLLEYKIPKEFHSFEIDWQKLINHDWQGNIRELKALVERYIILGNWHIKLQPLGATTIEKNTHKSIDFSNSINDLQTLEDFEKIYITHVLKTVDYKLSGKNSASEILGIHYTTLKTKMRKYDL